MAGIAGALRSRLMAERLARKSQDGTIGQTTEMHEDELLKDMNINVGDVYYGAQQQPPQQPEPVEQPQPQPTQPQQPDPQGPVASQQEAAPGPMVKRIWPYVLGAALAGGGLGAGAALLPQLFGGPDSDTKYDLRISSGDEQSGTSTTPE